MKNCCSTSAHRNYIESISFAPWTVSAATIVAYLFCGTHIAPCTSSRPPEAAFALTHSVHGLNHGWTPDRSQ